MTSRAFAVLACALVAGCGTPPGVNSDLPYGAFVATKAPPLQPGAVIAIVPTGPPLTDPKQNVTGTSCKNLMWQPAPTEAAAIEAMKRQAAERGFNAIHSVVAKPDARALIMNCWSAITATGIAFTETPTPPAAAM